MWDLADIYQHFHENELWEYGAVTSIAVNSPKDLKKLEPGRQFNVDMSLLPPMLRIPKKKQAA